MGYPTDDDESIEHLEYAGTPAGGLVLQTEPGTYVLFPFGIGELAAKFKAIAITVNPDGDIEVLREGLGNKLKWVSIVEDTD
jgi:hypothetical protein